MVDIVCLNIIDSSNIKQLKPSDIQKRPWEVLHCHENNYHFGSTSSWLRGTDCYNLKGKAGWNQNDVGIYLSCFHLLNWELLLLIVAVMSGKVFDGQESPQRYSNYVSFKHTCRLCLSVSVSEFRPGEHFSGNTQLLPACWALVCIMKGATDCGFSLHRTNLSGRWAAAVKKH